MSFCLNFPLFLIVASLLFSVVSSLLDSKKARILTLALLLASCCCNLIILLYVKTDNLTYQYMMGHFPAPWGNEIRISTLEALFSTIFACVFFYTLLSGKEPIDQYVGEERKNLYYSLCDLVNAALLVLVYTNDIFTGYVFVEIMTLASCGILCMKNVGRSFAAAARYMLFALVGSGLFLLGVIFLYNITGHLLMPNLKEAVANLWISGKYHLPLLASICLISVGISIKSGLFPFHFWMADTYGEAIPTSSGILSGLVSKAYIFFLLKVIFDVFGTSVFYSSGINNVFYFLGAMGIVFGSIGALKENHIFRMCAYSSAAQIGYIYFAFGISPSVGVIASLYQIFNHTFTKPALFLASYRLSKVSGGAKKFKNLEGSFKKDPFSAIAFTLEALSMIGFPLTMGFISKFIIATSVFDNPTWQIVLTIIVLIISTILNTLYFTRTIITIFNTDSSVEYKRELPPLNFMIGMSVFMMTNIVAGVIGSRLLDIINLALEVF